MENYKKNKLYYRNSYIIVFIKLNIFNKLFFNKLNFLRFV